MQDAEPDKETLRLLHVTIQRVTDDLDGLRFNTAIAAMMEFTNHLTKLTARPKSVLETFVLLAGALRPAHGGGTLADARRDADRWPTSRGRRTTRRCCKADTIEVPVQVNGKLRSKVTVAADADEKTIEAAAMADEKVQTYVAGKQVKKLIIAKGKLVNIVVA